MIQNALDLFRNFVTKGLIPELGEDEAEYKAFLFLRNLIGNDNKQPLIELPQSE